MSTSSYILREEASIDELLNLVVIETLVLFEHLEFEFLSEFEVFAPPSLGVICERAQLSECVPISMKASRRGQVVRYLSEAELDQVIDGAQKADETRLVQRLCFVKDLHLG